MGCVSLTGEAKMHGARRRAQMYMNFEQRCARWPQPLLVKH